MTDPNEVTLDIHDSVLGVSIEPKPAEESETEQD